MEEDGHFLRVVTDAILNELQCEGTQKWGIPGLGHCQHGRATALMHRCSNPGLRSLLGREWEAHRDLAPSEHKIPAGCH